jgi:hypothetical protein
MLRRPISSIVSKSKSNNNNNNKNHLSTSPNTNTKTPIHTQKKNEQLKKNKKSTPIQQSLHILLWFICSALGSTYLNSKFLVTFKGNSSALTLVRFIGSTILGAILTSSVASTNNNNSSVKPSSIILLKQNLILFTIPALSLLGANLFNSIALSKSGITLTYVTKAGIPLVTVAILALRHQFVTPRTIATLIPITFGVALSAWTDNDFTIYGFLAAITSTVSQAYLNISSKESITKSGISGSRAQFLLTSIASFTLGTLTVVYCLVDEKEYGLWKDIVIKSWYEPEGAGFILIATAVAYHLEYVLNFIVTEECSSDVVFAVLDVCRRLAIILAGAFLFKQCKHTCMPLVNLAGVVLALLGTVAFSISRSKEKQLQQLTEPSTPLLLLQQHQRQQQRQHQQRSSRRKLI